MTLQHPQTAGGSNMQAVIAEEPGGPEKLRLVELPDLQPDADEVAIAVAVAAISFMDTQVRAGTAPGPAASFPLVIGNGVGGTVSEVGEGVDASWIGASVITSTGGKGSYATQAIASVGDLHRQPTGLDLASAVALLADGRTAIGLIRAADIMSGDTVVVTAAAGGVGGLLVQLAVNAGARVIALAGSRTKLDHAHGLGANITINYRQSDWPEQLTAAAPGGIDVGFDGIGGETSQLLFERLRSGGRFLPHGIAGGSWGRVDEDRAAARHITIIPLTTVSGGPEENYRLIEQAFTLAAAGTIRPTIGQTFPLEHAAAAHAAIEARSTIGKTLLVTPHEGRPPNESGSID
jgi:NADPH:quinone reductase